MELRSQNELVAAYFNEFIFRARRVGITVTKSDLAAHLGCDNSLVSKWLFGEREFPIDRINQVIQFIVDKERLVNTRELIDKLDQLKKYLEEIE